MIFLLGKRKGIAMPCLKSNSLKPTFMSKNLLSKSYFTTKEIYVKTSVLFKKFLFIAFSLYFIIFIKPPK